MMKEIIDYLNETAGRRFRLTPKHRTFINARINEGYEIKDFQHVVDVKVKEWGSDPKMAKYIRPETLFGNKFDGYLNQPLIKKKSPDGIPQDGWDTDEGNEVNSLFNDWSDGKVTDESTRLKMGHLYRKYPYMCRANISTLRYLEGKLDEKEEA